MTVRETAAHFAAWQIAGPLEERGHFVERDGPVVAVEIDGVRYVVTVTAEPAGAGRVAALPAVSDYAKRLGAPEPKPVRIPLIGRLSA